uniref:Uncharacterized protein n=1 Tax=Anguilla anguilla TaxID=7936 RepID=A0A0E9RUY0_ANGAN
MRESKQHKPFSRPTRRPFFISEILDHLAYYTALEVRWDFPRSFPQLYS